MLDNSTSTSGQRSCIQLLSTATECACAFRVFFCIFIPFQEDYGDACFPVRLKLMSSNRTAGTFLDAGRKVSIPGLVLLATSRPSNYAVSDFTRGTRHPQHFLVLRPPTFSVVGGPPSPVPEEPVRSASQDMCRDNWLSCINP